MTPEHKELVRRIRCWNGQAVGPMAFQAADAIEVLSAENAELKARFTQALWRIPADMVLEEGLRKRAEAAEQLADRLKAEIETLVGKFKADTVALEGENARLRDAIDKAHALLDTLLPTRRDVSHDGLSERIRQLEMMDL